MVTAATFLRGVTPTDEDGVAQMKSIFPGHYEGRATHVHFIGNHGGTVLDNNTYSGGSVAHVGQFFFDQSLTTLVEGVIPYSTNTKQAITLNSDDKWLKAAAENDYDPIMSYALLDDTVDDGLFLPDGPNNDDSATSESNSGFTSSGSTSATSASANTETSNGTCIYNRFLGSVVVLLATLMSLVMELAPTL
ncbi:unnamed protein product [Phytophthora lilii]|uniref:Unnamed protein product n=1 Tax=Phytophthora lilii TaxID=2077276 RepID=A0A9W6U0R5_9STRA|nr:unnamed protein product [Phytophthora lilii]